MTHLLKAAASLTIGSNQQWQAVAHFDISPKKRKFDNRICIPIAIIQYEMTSHQITVAGARMCNNPKVQFGENNEISHELNMSYQALGWFTFHRRSKNQESPC